MLFFRNVTRLLDESNKFGNPSVTAVSPKNKFFILTE
jgi:hypothetical protein